MVASNSKRLRVSLSLFLVFITFFNIGHFFLSKNSYDEKKEFFKLTSIPGVVRSVSYFEHRIKGYDDYSTSYIHNIKNINSLDITYE